MFLNFHCLDTDFQLKQGKMSDVYEQTDEYIINKNVPYYDKRTEEDELFDEHRMRKGLNPVQDRPWWFDEIRCQATSRSDGEVIAELCAVLINLDDARECLEYLKNDERKRYDDLRDYVMEDVDLEDLLSEADLSCRNRYSTVTSLVGGLLTHDGGMRIKWYRSDFPETRGTGVWGEELSSMKNVLLLEDFHVEPDWRGQGLGTKIVQYVLNLNETYCGKEELYLFVRPRPDPREYSRLLGLLRGADVPVYHQITRRAEAFWRAQGFRRVAKSDWFAYTTNADHPSRKLTIADDEAIDHDLKEFGVRPAWLTVVPAHMARLVQDLGKQHTTDEECTALLREQMPEDPNHEDWGVRGECGNTLLHLAAVSSKLEAIRFVLERQPRLAEVKNMGGRTPLEALEHQLGKARERDYSRERFLAICAWERKNWRFFEDFPGLNDKAIRSWCLLSGTPYMDVSGLAVKSASELGEDREVVQELLELKYCCGCGSCLGGWFSQRSQVVLAFAAREMHSRRVEGLEQMGFLQWYDLYIKDSCDFITREETTDNEQAALWVVEVFQHLELCIAGTDDTAPMIPNLRNIMASIEAAQNETPQPADLHGRIDAVIEATCWLIGKAEGTWDNMREDRYIEDGEELTEELKELSHCDNDGYYWPLYTYWKSLRGHESASRRAELVSLSRSEKGNCPKADMRFVTACIAPLHTGASPAYSTRHGAPLSVLRRGKLRFQSRGL